MLARQVGEAACVVHVQKSTRLEFITELLDFDLANRSAIQTERRRDAVGEPIVGVQQRCLEDLDLVLVGAFAFATSP